MIVFCLLLYIPIYNRANKQSFQDSAIEDWPIHQKRDTKIYVQPYNITTRHEPKHICPPHTRNKKNNLLLLIIVCSSTTNFDRRVTIRETWGNYKTYLQLSKNYNKTREKYKDYKYTYNLSYSRALQDILDDNTNEEQTMLHEEKREVIIPEFNISKDLVKDDDYVSNVKKIPPKYLKDNGNLINKYYLEKDDIKVEEPDFKLLFLLGLPNNDDTDIQNKIEEEVQTYGDILQEGFIDSYYNLTLKSTMMLKWVTNTCNESVRYILKTDDDIYINVPALVTNLRSRSLTHDLNHPHSKEYLLIGRLFCCVTPSSDKHDKWYAPRYMFPKRVYPRYLSGTAYALSSPTAAALYHAALYLDLFHLEDVFITGICARRASLRPRHDDMFSHIPAASNPACTAHAHYSTHRLRPDELTRILATLLDPDNVDQCERERIIQTILTQMKEPQDILYKLKKYIESVFTFECE